MKVLIELFQTLYNMMNTNMKIEDLKNKILDSEQLQYTHQVINVRKFLHENEQFFDKLSRMMESRTIPTLTAKIPHKSKSVSKFSLPRPPTPNSSFLNLQKRNAFLQGELTRLRKEQSSRQLQENPRLLTLQSEIEDMETEVEIKSQINKQFKDVSEKRSDLFEMYQKMCRRCEIIRQQNDQFSESIKDCIKKINEITGKDENPNLFIMNFK